MTTLREQILAKFVTVWGGVANVTGYRSRKAAIARVEGNAFIVFPESEQPEKRATQLVMRDFIVAVSVLTRGDIPDQVADPIVQSGHALTMADPTLGGLCSQIIEHSTAWQMEEADLTACETTVRYLVRYQTKPNDLTQAL